MATSKPNSTAQSSAIERSVALMTDVMGEAMTEPCPVCRGGLWLEDGHPAAAVHAAECPYKDREGWS